jgi:catechol 2,3-dioxygenase-like lactoylglutathione lyase family enzyme
MIAGFDHVALAVRDLDSVRAGLERLLGRTAEWVGADGGARHAWFQLDNMALDIIASTGAGLTGDQIAAHIERHGESIWAVAFGCPDLERTRRLFANRDLGPSDIGRIRATREGGDERQYWTMATIPPERLGGVRAFLIDQRTAFDWPRAHPTGGAEIVGLDHLVVRSPAPERALALYGARLGLDLRLDRSHPEWGARLQFFLCGDAILEVAHALNAGAGEGDDALWGLSWRVADADAAQARIAAAGFDCSPVRTGRKPGTRVFTVRNAPASIPTLVVQPPAGGPA